MRRHRGLPAASAASVLIGVATLAGPAPAHAAAVFVELNPSTVPAGDRVSLRASCPDNLRAATVRSVAFGEVQVTPRYGFLTAIVTVPADRRPDDYRVRLICPGNETADSTLHVVAGDHPTRGPATGFGGTAGGGAGPALVTAGLLTVLAGAGLGVWTVRRRPGHR